MYPNADPVAMIQVFIYTLREYTACTRNYTYLFAYVSGVSRDSHKQLLIGLYSHITSGRHFSDTRSAFGVFGTNIYNVHCATSNNVSMF